MKYYYISNINNIFQDHDIIHAWLLELQFEEYAPLFAAAGYDLRTVTRMTPEDLTAIGIKKPNHRKQIKTEIAKLTVPENLPDYIPVSLFFLMYIPHKSQLLRIVWSQWDYTIANLGMF